MSDPVQEAVAFAKQAVLADQAGDLSNAISLYQSAISLILNYLPRAPEKQKPALVKYVCY